MKVFRFLLLVLCLPAFLLLPIPLSADESPVFRNEEGKELYVPRDEFGKVNPWELFKYEKLCFQNTLEFLEILEYEAFWESLDLEELDRIVAYLTWSMQNYAPSSRPDLQEEAEQAIAELEAIMRDEPVWSYYDEIDDYRIDPASLSDSYYILKCGWLSDKWKQTKKWLKKHKKPLIAVGVVATVLVVGAVTGGIGASSAVAVGGALAGGAMDDPPDHINKPGEVITQQPQTPTSPPSSIKPQTPLQQASSVPHTAEKLEDIIAVVEEKKEELTEIQPETTLNKISDFGCSLGHSIVDGVASVVEYFYDDTSLEDYLDFLRSVDEYHEKVDNVFARTETELDTNKLEMQMGVPPVPGGKLLPAIANRAAGAAVGGAIVGGTITSSVVQEVGNVSVYRAFNEVTGEVSYVGITNNVPRRYGEHLRGKGIQIEEMEGLTNFTRADAKAVEETLIALHQLEKDGGTLINKIHSIAETNPIRAESVARGAEILKEAGYLE